MRSDAVSVCCKLYLWVLAWLSLGELHPPLLKLVQLQARAVGFILTGHDAAVWSGASISRCLELMLIVLEPKVVCLLDGVEVERLQLNYFLTAALHRSLQVPVHVSSIVDGENLTCASGETCLSFICFVIDVDLLAFGVLVRGVKPHLQLVVQVTLDQAHGSYLARERINIAGRLRLNCRLSVKSLSLGPWSTQELIFLRFVKGFNLFSLFYGRFKAFKFVKLLDRGQV